MKLASIINRYCLQHPTLTPVYLSVPDCSKWSWQVSGRSCEVSERSCVVIGRSWHWERGYILGITRGYLRDILGISGGYIGNILGVSCGYIGGVITLSLMNLFVFGSAYLGSFLE